MPMHSRLQLSAEFSDVIALPVAALKYEQLLLVWDWYFLVASISGGLLSQAYYDWCETRPQRPLLSTERSVLASANCGLHSASFLVLDSPQQMLMASQWL
uniref:Uncharacterized protein n=1 Tax=Schistocephalus solidus TaxID=70667 RepID=A0A0X3NKU1_SCHSO